MAVLTTFLLRAEHHLALGFQVFPLAVGSKVPAVSFREGGRGCLDATDDPHIVQRWAEQYPHANVGIAAGKPSGFIAVDIDRKGGVDGFAALEERGLKLPPTVRALTPTGGEHWLYAYDTRVSNSAGQIAPGIDMRTTGGYIVGAHSVLDDGTCYEWIKKPLCEIRVPLPDWLVPKKKRDTRTGWVANREIERRRAKVSGTGLDRVAAQKIVDLSAAPEGERNQRLYSLACWLKFRDQEGFLTASDYEAHLRQAAVQCGLAQAEINRTIRSAQEGKRT